MGKVLKRGQAGNAAQYLTRNQALKKLQLKLSEFRRLCILKGIHPREPRKKPHGRHRTYYHAKDIAFLAHEPLLNKFRADAALERRIRRARAKGNPDAARRLEAAKPVHGLDHLVRERYPTLADALRDLDDPLTLAHLFAALAADERAHIPRRATAAARALSLEWQAWVARTHALRKAFISVKGYYFQADVNGTPVTWLVPHALAQVVPPDVDCRVMLTFLELGCTLLRFVHYRLYASAGLAYPPAPDPALDGAAAGLDALMRGLAAAAAAAAQPAGALDAAPAARPAGPADAARRAALPAKLQALAAEEGAAGGSDDDAGPGSIDSGPSDDDGQEGAGAGAVESVPPPATPGALATTTTAATPAPSSDADACARLFRGLTFYLAREVPREPLLLVIRSFGGAVAWEGPGSPLPSDDPSITHTVMDRPAIPGAPVPGRSYIQPQWVFDSANFRVRADERKYAPGLTPPPHLSPFAEPGDDGGYTPAYAEELTALRAATAGAGGAADAAEHAATFEAEAAAVGEGGRAAAPAAALAPADPAAAAERAHADGLAKELGLKPAGGPPTPAAAAAPNTDDADAVALRKALLPRKARNLYESVAKNQAAKAARGAALAARRAELEAARKRKK